MRRLLRILALLAAYGALPGAGAARSLAGDMSGWTVTRAEFEAGVTQITAQPHDDNATSYYVAPAALLGDWSQGDYILLEKRSSGGRYFSGSHGDVGDIVLSGPAGTASFRLPEDHTGNWRRFRVPLDGAGWQISGGTGQLKDILGNVTGFRIRAEYGVGDDVSALRGVVVVFKDPGTGPDAPGAAWKPVGKPVAGGLTSKRAVQNGPARPTMFKLTAPMRLDRISTYHWNHGRGAPPGTIGLKAQDGTLLGPWPTTGSDGMGGVANANWHAKPGVVLAPGQYEIIDSSPETWSTNDELGGRGYFTVALQPVEKSSPPEQPAPDRTGNAGDAVWSPVGERVQIYEGPVRNPRNGASRPARFTLEAPMRLLRLTTDHWNDGKGVEPGTIGLKTQDGTLLGPWAASAVDPARQTTWFVKPGIVLEPGTYEIIDSDRETWTTDDQRQGRGAFMVTLQPVERVVPDAGSDPGQEGQAGRDAGPGAQAPAAETGPQDIADEKPGEAAPTIREDLDISDLLRKLEEIVGTDGR